MPLPTVTAAEAFEGYEAIRPRLPTAKFPKHSIAIENLGELVNDFDVFLLDAFGVLNVGEQTVPGAAERLDMLSSLGKQVFVLTNSATYDASHALMKYRKFGFDLEKWQVISSRDAAFTALQEYPRDFVWGVAATPYSALSEFSCTARLLADDPTDYEAADGFLFLSSAEWTLNQQQLLSRSILHNPRPLIVGNPDLVAPREDGLSLEPGFFAHDMADRLGITPFFYGKPFSDVFEKALNAKQLTGIDRRRIAMVGDTLHTDILGGAAAGVRTVLITDHGLFKGMNVDQLIKRSGIVPDFIAKTT